LVMTVEEMRGDCPFFKVGRQNSIDSSKIVVDKTDNLCAHALGRTLSMILPLSSGISFKQLGLSKEKVEKAASNV
jgi:uncharacterized repeat protein (TIGR04076 family)